MRLVPLATLLAAPLALAACGGSGGDADTDGTEIPDETSPTPHTGEEIEEYSIDGAFWGVTGRFAFDDAADRHVAFVEPGGGPTPISVAVTILDSSIQETGVIDETTSCTVTLEHDGALPIAPWVETHALWTGFDLPAGATVRDGCKNYYGLPVEILGDVGGAVAQWSWGIGLGPLDAEIREQVRAQLDPSEWDALEPNLVGGAILSPLFATGGTESDGYSDAGFALGYEVDGNYEVVVGGTGVPTPIPSAVIDGETGVATGYYEVVMGYWTNAGVLAGPGQ